MRYLLDTNICIYLIKEQPPQVRARLAPLALGDVLMSALTYAELWHGVMRCGPAVQTAAEHALRGLVARIPVLDFNAASAEQYGVLAAPTAQHRRNLIDRLIAAHALAARLILVTHNEADFRDIEGLTIENWARAE